MYLIHVFVVGSYCTEGTASPTACPPGTYGAATGLRNVSECTQCTAGSYCTTPGLTATEGLLSDNEKVSFMFHQNDLSDRQR